MKKLTLMVVMIGLLMVGNVLAQDDESFNITVTCQYIDISLYQSSSTSTTFSQWDIDTVALSTADSMDTGDGNHVYIKNNCNITTDYSCYSEETSAPTCSHGSPTAWSPGGPGDNQYKLEVGHSADPSTYPSSWTAIPSDTSPGDLYASGVSAADNKEFFAKFTTPSTISDGCEHSITVHIVASP